jgi:hypothetical protein
MPRRDSEIAVVNICDHADEILFSSSPKDYREATHFNVHTPDYWVRLFAREGYYRDVSYDVAYITPWAMRLRHDLTLIDDVLVPYERRLWTHELARQEMRKRLLELEQRLRQVEEVASMPDHEMGQDRIRIGERLRNTLDRLESRLGIRH